MNRRIILSDLHVDTWTDRKIRGTGKNKKEHFNDFMDWCESANIKEFIINGDLMDFPPYTGYISFTESSGTARGVINRIARLADKIPVTYIFGNHDIGISGIRSLRENNLKIFGNMNFCYPGYIVEYGDCAILIEHGHFCDPALILYLRDLADRTYRESKFEGHEWMQAGQENVEAPTMKPGLITPIRVEPGGNAFLAAKQPPKPAPKRTICTKIKEILWRWGATAIAPYTMEWWWLNANEGMGKFIKNTSYKKSMLYQIYGHTHRADARDPEVMHGVSCFYINAGTWTEEVDEGWYLDIDEKGKVWLQDWINEPEEMRNLQPATST
jgi:UDP-2,3-diacylglucosamine pyrophosphatase LpxH